jgi:hypothetical protein
VVKDDNNPAVLQVVRYGLPLVILVFYVSASWNFSYTPDNTFLSLRIARDITSGGALEPVPGHPGAASNPLWVLFIALGSFLKLDLLAVAKVFGLFFSCMAVLVSYLLATEILRDRFLAFCSALAVATSGLLLQVAPSGTALPLALSLTLLALFFMLRNDYLLSSLMLGIATLLYWQALGAFILLLCDAWLNSVTPRQRVRALVLSSLVFLCAVVPWVLFVGLRSVPPFPWLVGLGDFPGGSLLTGGAAALPALIAAIASVRMVRHQRLDGIGRQSHIVIIIWACWFLASAAVWGWDFFLIALPVIVIYALSITQELRLMPRAAAAYARSLFLTGVLILVHQLAFAHAAKPVMLRTERDTEELVELAYWIKNGIPEEASISAVRPERLAYYAGRPVSVWNSGDRPTTDYVVSDAEDLWGYDLVHRASRLDDDQLLTGAGRYAIWKKK